METLTGRTVRLLRLLYEKGEARSVYSVQIKQGELAKQLGISRQALNVHIKKLRELKYVRTGRGFIDITEIGASMLRTSSNPAFIFVKAPPIQRAQVYQQIGDLPVRKAFRVTGDVDAILIVESEELDQVLSVLSKIDGVEDTKSYVAIEPIK